jgi:hypothetical protein
LENLSHSLETQSLAPNGDSLSIWRLSLSLETLSPGRPSPLERVGSLPPPPGDSPPLEPLEACFSSLETRSFPGDSHPNQLSVHIVFLFLQTLPQRALEGHVTPLAVGMTDAIDIMQDLWEVLIDICFMTDIAISFVTAYDSQVIHP